MEIFIVILRLLTTVIGILAVLLSILLFIQLHWPAPVLWFLKLYTSALSPWLVLFGFFSVVVGGVTGSYLTCSIGIYIVLIYGQHIFRVTRPPATSGNFEKAFNKDWADNINPDLKKHFLSARSVFKLPVVPDPRLEQNILFATIPGSGRSLLCDLWQPPLSINPSGLAFIYLHGSAWYMMDKDLGTRPFFRHLAAQGHLVMDVAYRLAPETDLLGMVQDVKRSIAWMKEHGGVDPAKIVVGGASAGGHLALLAAYAEDPVFTPKELEGKDLMVSAVVSLYGPADLTAMYYHTNQHLTTRSTPGRPKKPVPTKMPAWVIKSMGEEYHHLGLDKGMENAGTFATLLGGHPDECPELYALFSPITHVHSGCPPTLLIHGEQDVMAPVKSTRSLFSRLTEEKIQAIQHILPQTDHAFDLILPRFSPAAHNAIYDIERFLKLISLWRSL